MRVPAKAKPRERIISTAAKLFYDHGINPVGVAQICETANVSKRTLYKHFATKEDLVSAAMIELGDAWYKACTSSDADDPRRRISHIFQMMESVAEKPDFYGCIFMNTSIELRGTTAPAASVVRELKTKLYDYFRQQAIAMNAKDPEVVAEQLVVLYDGCSAWIVMHRKFPSSAYQTLVVLLS